MKRKGVGGIGVKSISVATLFCCVLLSTVMVGEGKRGFTNGARSRTAGASQTGKPRAHSENTQWAEAYGRLPMRFEENQGQTAREVRYVAHGVGYELFLTPQEAVLALRPHQHLDLSPLHRAATIRALRNARKAAQQQMTAVRLQLEGANPNPVISGLGRLAGKVNYFIGNDPRKWHTDVPNFARVRYAEVYPGVDLVFYGNRRKLEYDFIVAPGADPSAIRLKIAGAHAMRVNSRGDVELSVPDGEVELQKPIVYQQIQGKRREIAGIYTIDNRQRVGFSVPSYDRNAPLILDPVLSYATYLGGTADDAAFAIAVDGSGDAFIAGQTMSTDFPAGTNGAVVAAPAANAGASFVAELDPTGANLLYSTYLAGSTTSANDSAFGIALDSSGRVYVTGETGATDFPTTASAFTPGPVSAAHAVNGTVFLTKLDPTVSGISSLIYSTYVSGTGGEYANSVAVDAAGNAYLGGQTSSIDFPTASPLQSSPSNAFGTGFLTRIDTTKSGNASLIFSTYFGGNGVHHANYLNYGDQISGVAVDSSQNAYVTGQTSSTDSPASFMTGATAFQVAPPAGNTLGSVFVSKIATTAGTLSYSTYLAGSAGVGTAADQGFGIALGPANVVYVTGSTDSTDFPTTVNAFDTNGVTSGKAFITLLDATKIGANSLTYSTLLGGSGGATGNSISVDSTGNAYVAGTTASPDFAGAGTLASLGAMQTTLLNPSIGDAFIAKLNPAGGGASDLLYATFYGGSNGTIADQGFGIAIDSASPPNAYITGQTLSTDLPVLSPLAKGGSLQGPSDAYVAKLALIPTLTVTPSPSFDFGIQPVGVTTNPQPFTVTNNTANAATFTSIAVNGVSPAANTDFTISSDACSPSVAAGLSCTVNVKFTPSVAVAESATLVITAVVSNGGQNSAAVLNVNLAGTGAASAPGVGLVPTGLAFGNQLLNTTSAAKTVTLTNTGNAALTINTIAASGDFAETSTGAAACPISPATLAAGANCAISVTFTPTAVGIRPGTLTITDNAGGSPQMVPLTGTGTAPGVALAPTSLAFGNQLLNTTSAAMPVTLTNTGTGALTITSIAASGDFAVSNNPCGANLAAGANCIISVTFTPTALGARTGNLTITDIAASSPQMVPLTGTGTGAPAVGLAPANLAFGNQAQNTTSAAKTVTLTNTGTAALTITSIAVSGDFAVSNNPCGASLAAGANCIISVTFTPTALGGRAGTLTITDNAAGSPHTVPLTGTGTSAPDFGLTGPAGVQNVPLGQTFNFNVTVTGTGGFNSPVALACTGAPMLATCTVASPVTPPVAPPSTIQAQVSVTTTALVPPPQGMPTPTAPPQQVVPLVLALMLLLSLVWARQPRMRLAVATTVLMLIALAGCNGLQHQHTPKGPATLTITGTSGALTHNVQVQISVN